VLSTEQFFKDTFEPCTVYGVPAVLALWYPPGAPTMARGLIFLAEDDDAARSYALAKFRAQSFTL
jgi:2-hydroxychromene-2-carboxylate isomerase